VELCDPVVTLGPYPSALETGIIKRYINLPSFFTVKYSTDDGVHMSVGFTELCQDDQIKLIKQGSFEVILARYVPLFTDDGMFVPDMSAKVPRFVTILSHINLLFLSHYIG